MSTHGRHRRPILALLIAALLTTLLTACQPEVLSVTIRDGDLTLHVGTVRQLTATVAVRGSANRTVTWASHHPHVATVTPTGLLTALTPGTTTITATSQGDPEKRGSMSLTVMMDPTGIAIRPGASDCAGTVVDATCTVRVDLESNADWYEAVSFEITNERFALLPADSGPGALTSDCLFGAGATVVGMVCPSAFGGNGSIANLTFIRLVGGASTFTVEDATLVDANLSETRVAGGELAID